MVEVVDFYFCGYYREDDVECVMYGFGEYVFLYMFGCNFVGRVLELG